MIAPFLLFFSLAADPATGIRPVQGIRFEQDNRSGEGVHSREGIRPGEGNHSRQDNRPLEGNRSGERIRSLQNNRPVEDNRPGEDNRPREGNRSGEGIRPVGADGQPLNLDFETGTLADWSAEGEAFRNQPIKGDTVSARRKDMKANHQGEYWIGTYESGNGDKPTGTLTSREFKVTHPYASFLIGGGNLPGTRVEILLADRGEVIRQAHGMDQETMQRVVLHLEQYLGQRIQIRVVDEATSGWGHINFDDFLFHPQEPKFAGARRIEAPSRQPSELKHAGLPPEQAAAAMSVPAGFEVKLFAGEPDVHQPIAFCFDDRGRLWVVEAYIYPRRHPHPGPLLPPHDRQHGDRIVIFEDSNGDGRHDQRTVFIEGLNLVSGIEYGYGGLYIGAAPYLLFIPIKDDRPAGEPVILLDGWGYEDTHETLNAFLWGPDGWLYGCHGVFTHSNVGKPGTPEKDRIKLNAGVWRYHPTRHSFEVVAHGTSNPWGLDYNDRGDFFVSACVIPHLFHIVPGGRYQRQAGEHFNKHTYIDIPTIADHLHFVGSQWSENDRKESDDAGGGHAHCGLMCYQGGSWPKDYHGQLFMGNIHGRRINMDTLHPKGSSYLARHGKDFLLANDAWARFIALKYGPDGDVYLLDWYDKQACHRTEPEVWDRSNGRIYKIRYRGSKPITNLNLQRCTDQELVDYHRHENEWYARHARRILLERAARGELTAIATSLRSLLSSQHPVPIRLRGLWTAQALGVLTQDDLLPLATDADSEVMRAWALSALMELPGKELPPDRASGSMLALMERLYPLQAACSPAGMSPRELRHWVHTAATFPPEERFRLLQFILETDEPSWRDDPQIPALIWYALEPLVAEHPDRCLALAGTTKIPHLLDHTIRRVGTTGRPEAVDLLLKHLRAERQQRGQLAYLNGLREIMLRRGGRPAQPHWLEAVQEFHQSDSASVREAALNCLVVMREPAALETLRTSVLNSDLDNRQRLAALQSLIQIQDRELSRLFSLLMDDVALRSQAIRAMASLGADDTPKVLLATYARLSATEKREAIATLAAKPAYAQQLLDAIAAKSIPASDVPAETIRQLRSFNDPAISNKVVALWGTVRELAEERKVLIAEWRRKLTLTHDPDLPHGRAVFARICAQCHALYGVGGKIGPDITGSNRADLNYLLENIFDPSAIIPKEYAATTFDLTDGRRLTGIVKEDGDQIELATATETVRFSAEDVERRRPSELSMMPDDLVAQLTETEVKDLIWYLRHNRQVPMKATADNARDLFNGRDLAGWEGDTRIWSIDQGEIVGRTTEPLRHNSFLQSHLDVQDFRLSLQVKLTPDSGNSGIQFRSTPMEAGGMRGPQADIGQGWWGKLYEEHGRGLLVRDGGEHLIRRDDWNDYSIEARGPHVKIWINGELVCDYVDDALARRGIIALQMHSGPPQEVRFRNLKLEVLSGK